MSASKIIIRPGVNTNVTPLLNESGVSSSQLVRFFNGMLQKLGGWAKYVGTAVFGVCRGLFTWEDLSAQSYVVAGTNSTLEVVYQDAIYDITPQVSVENLSDPFTTIVDSNYISVSDTAHGEVVGDAIYIVTETSINGQLLIGYQSVVSVEGSDNYTIITPDTFSASVSGATTALYTTTMSSAIVTVTLENHGRVVGEIYTINVSTAVGSLVLEGNYQVASVIDADNFTFDAGTPASSDDTGNENGGDIRINYLLEAGLVSATPQGGYGVGTYGIGTYGIGTISTANTPLRQWFFGNWGEILISNPSGGKIYKWDPSSGVTDNPATEIVAAPTANAMFISMPQRQVVALGADGDALLIKWSDVDDFDQWTPSITNEAGSYRLPKGSRIIGGIQGPQQGLIWTDLGLWTMNYIQPPFIYGFNEVGSGCGLIGARAMGILGGKVIWMTLKNFFIYDGQVNPLPCPVWDQIFSNFNLQQAEKITCAVNSLFNEITWYFPSAQGGSDEQEVNSYVKYNIQDKVWDTGQLTRTAWFDQSVIGPPIGVDFSGYIQQHEISNNDDGQPMNCNAQTGLFKIAEGLMFIFIERMFPYFVFLEGSTVQLGIVMYEYPNEGSITYAERFVISQDTEYIIVRARGRYASITINSHTMDSFWRLGELTYIGSAAGRR